MDFYIYIFILCSEIPCQNRCQLKRCMQKILSNRISRTVCSRIHVQYLAKHFQLFFIQNGQLHRVRSELFLDRYEWNFLSASEIFNLNFYIFFWSNDGFTKVNFLTFFIIVITKQIKEIASWYLQQRCRFLRYEQICRRFCVGL